jgi:hypothetical protein
VYPASVANMAHASGMGKYIAPGGKGGFHLASADLERVKEWAPFWDSANTNIAVRTGAASRLVILDLDVAGGGFVRTPDGSVSLQDVDRVGARSVYDWQVEAGQRIPDDAVSTTPGGGKHVWLRMPNSWAIEVPKRIRWREKVDLLWDRHSIKAPPSQRVETDRKRAGAYRFATGCPCRVPVVDSGLLVAMTDTPSIARNIARTRTESEGTGTWTDGQINVPFLLEHGVSLDALDGQNGQFHRIACSLARTGVALPDAVDILVRIAEASPTGREQEPWHREHFEWSTNGDPGIVVRAYRFIAQDTVRENAALRAAADAMLRRTSGDAAST